MLKENERKYLCALAEKYPDRESATAEVVRLASELYLPKGTEHFLSDLHGEYEAFSHIKRSASGVIRRKIDALFPELSDDARGELAAIIYYPKEKLKALSVDGVAYERIIPALVRLLSVISGKYPRKRVRAALDASGKYSKVIYELLYSGGGEKDKQLKSSVKTIIRLGECENFITSLSSAIRELAVDRVHIVGDIFDRGPRPDRIIDELTKAPDVDIQWGNHDILWMGAASGSEACIAAALLNSLTYRNLDFIETGYGISLRPLAEFAKKTYGESSLDAYMPKGDNGGLVILGDPDRVIAAMRKAVAVILWKLEGEIISRNPSFDMEDRLLLDKIDGDRISIGNESYVLSDPYFPTVDKDHPYTLTPEEKRICDYLVLAFKGSEKLKRHISFLYKVGGMYKIYNRNLLFHGSVPMTDDGDLLPLRAAGGRRGRELMDYCDYMAREAFFSEDKDLRRQALDFTWFLWCGKNSPLTGREKIATLERLLIKDEEAHKEARNPYYKIWDRPDLAEKLLSEFGLSGRHSHIINGHIPVKKGESPIKADGRLILIDGGFCHAFLGRTGIAGYTLIYNSEGMRISAHEPFPGKEAVITSNADIAYDTSVFEVENERIKIIQTDKGKEMIDKIADLMLLREAYAAGDIKENGRL